MDALRWTDPMDAACHTYGLVIASSALLIKVFAMRVIGTVLEEESGKPLQGLQVRAFDKDVFFDDKLGVAITDAAGAFRINYSSLDFSLVEGLETSPELYIRVFDATGKKQLYTSKSEIRRNVQVEEEYTIKIPKSKLA